MAMPGAMGLVPLSHQEIHAWASLNNLDLDPWEIIALRASSGAYVSQLNSKSIAPPFVREVEVKPSFIGKFKSLAAKVNKNT